MEQVIFTPETTPLGMIQASQVAIGWSLQEQILVEYLACFPPMPSQYTTILLWEKFLELLYMCLFDSEDLIGLEVHVEVDLPECSTRDEVAYGP